MDGILSGVANVTVAEDISFQNIITKFTTLTSSGITKNIELSEVRCGQSNSVISKVKTQDNVEISMEDACFSLDRVLLNTGGEIKYGAEWRVTEQVTADENGKFTIKQTPIALTGTKVYGNITKMGENNFYSFEFIGKEGTVKELANETACVSFFIENEDVKTLKVGADSMPKTCALLYEIPIYGIKSQAGKVIAKAQVLFPSVQFNGELNIDLQAGNANSTTPLSATVLLSDSVDSCDGGENGTYFKFNILSDEHWYDDVISLVVDDIVLKVGDDDIEPEIIAINRTVSNAPIGTNKCTLVSTTTDKVTIIDGKVHAVATTTSPVEITVALKDKPSVTTTFEVTVTA